MKFSITELKVISEIGRGNNNLYNITKSLNISMSQIYRIAEKLNKKGILHRKLRGIKKGF